MYKFSQHFLLNKQTVWPKVLENDLLSSIAEIELQGRLKRPVSAASGAVCLKATEVLFNCYNVVV